LNPRTRRRFDEQLDWVLAQMPPLVHQLIERVPLHVEDYPSDAIMDEKNIEYIDELCGLYTGIPIGDKSVSHSGMMPDVVTIYREGILSASADASGHITTERLREQIRITILHELGHHHGLDERDLEELGYG
jgi:predicted Zn-dependent protease with MMP-like domain